MNIKSIYHRNFYKKIYNQFGFSFIELSVILSVASLLSWAIFSGYETVAAQQEREMGQATGQQLQSILRAFAMRHGRLPCPDITGNGYESITNEKCTDNNQLGWFPYISLEQELPPPILQARYGVFRDASADADLAVIKERTGDNIGDTNYMNATDLIVGLNNAASLPFSPDRIYLTGDSAAWGNIDCTNNRISNVAYWLVIPLKDKNNDGDRLDPPHTMTSLCAVGSAAPLRLLSDDVTISESPAQLAGWLRKSMP